MFEYSKIETCFARNVDFKLDLSRLKNPLIRHVRFFHFTEKIHGMNIRIIWDGVAVKFCGRTDRAELPGRLKEYLAEKFTPETLKECFGNQLVVLYGEGYGPKINNGELYCTTQKFSLFDVLIVKEYGSWWLNYENILAVGEKLKIDCAPDFGYMTIDKAIDIVKVGFKSKIFIDEINKPDAEGLVGKADLYDNNGKRIVIKLKTCDF